MVAWGEPGAARIQRVNFLGAKVWGPAGVDIAPGNAMQLGVAGASPAASGDDPLDLLPLGCGALVAFSTVVTADFDIFVQKVDPSGTIQWGPDGVTLCSATGAQIRPAIVSDGETGNLLPSGVYFVRVNASGTCATRKFVLIR